MARSFSDQLGEFCRRSGRDMNRVKKAVAIKLFNAIVMDTPVLTGHLRGNWRFSIGTADTSTSPITRDETGAISTQLINITVNSSQGDDAIIMSNSLPYVQRIEYDGWSHTKAPFGMVRRNVIRFEILLQEALGDSFSSSHST